MLLKWFIVSLVIHLVSSEGCKHILAYLADSQMRFVSCVTKNSVPVTVCITCKEQYETILHSYDLLLANCSQTYFDKDRINLIGSTEFLLTSLWTKAYCDDCFNNNNSIVFNEKNNTLTTCLHTNKEDPCRNCMLQYSDLNNFYINLDQHNNGEVCYDLQDSMNRTRNKWSKELSCCRREQNLTLFTIVLAITACLPLIFYGTTFYITKLQERSQRVLFNEDPYDSQAAPSTSPRRYNIINDVNNPISSTLDALPSTSNAANPAVRTSLPTNDVNKMNLIVDVESSDDESLLNTTNQSKENTKNKNI